MDKETGDRIEKDKDKIKAWPYSRAVLLPHPGEAYEAPRAGEIFRQADLADTLKKLVEAERQALAAGKTRREAIQAAYDRFYKGDIGREFVRGSRGAGRPHHHGGPGRLEGPSRGAGLDLLQRHRCLQADELGPGPGHAPGPEHARNARPQGPGLQQRRLHPHALPGHEPGLRRPGLLLRRSLFPARGAARRAPVQGLRARAGQAHPATTGTTPTSSPATRTPSRARPIPTSATSRTGSSGAGERPRSSTRRRRPRSKRPSAPARPRSRRPTRKAGSSP